GIVHSGHLLDNLAVNKTIRYELLPGMNLLTVVNPLENTKSCSTADCHAHPESHVVLGALVVRLQLKGLRTELRANAHRIMVFAFCLFMLISTVIGMGVIFLVSRPLARLRCKAERISRGDYVIGTPVTGSDSIAGLSRTLDDMSRQISERERQIDQSRRRYKELFEKVPCYIAIVSRDYRIVRANQAFLAEFGDQVGKNCFCAFKGRESKCNNCLVERTFQDGLTHKIDEVWNLAGRKKVHVIVHTTPLLDDNGIITEVMEMAVDVSRLVRLQEELKKKEEQFRTLFDNVPCYLTVVDQSYRLAFYNNMFGRDFGRKWGEKCFAAYKGLTHKCENCPVEQTFADALCHSSEEVWHQDGADIHIIVRTSPITDDTGIVVAVMEMCTNVTELKMLENKLALLGETIAGTSHAVKNILSGLEGGVYVVDSGLRSKRQDRVEAGWGMVKKNVGKVSDLVKDILYASKERVPEKNRADPGKLLLDLYELFLGKCRQGGVELTCDFDKVMGLGMIDSNGIHNVVSNLISNAMAACSFAENGEKMNITLHGRLENDRLIIRVADNGAGMTDEVKQNLFKKFYSTKGSKGTGLGLLVTRKIVEENGGTISCESTPGRGTTFIVNLPFKRIQS
ncbi:MAG: ATP-binding protein, partial [Pseudomonadota bacterium]